MPEVETWGPWVAGFEAYLQTLINAGSEGQPCTSVREDDRGAQRRKSPPVLTEGSVRCRCGLRVPSRTAAEIVEQQMIAPSASLASATEDMR